MMQNRISYKVTFLFSILFLAAIFCVSLFLGAEKLDLAQIFNSDSFSSIILFKLRLPRSLLVLLSGILLAGAGSVFQMFFRNPLAEPGIMGISSGATLGAILASIWGAMGTAYFLPFPPINLFAFAGALLSGFIVTLLASGKNSRDAAVMLLLCGTALGTLYSSVSSILLLTHSKELHTIYSWTLGSFNGRNWTEFFFILIPSFISIFIMFFIVPSLDLLTCGEQSAASLGLNVKTLRILVLISGALATSAAVCAGGTIAFVGLIAPHITRKLISSKAKYLIPFSMIFGAILLLIADILARIVIAPSELPTGIFTSILGVPFFISICINQRNSY